MIYSYLYGLQNIFLKEIEYEIQILNGADELKGFLIENYSRLEFFDKERLCDICSIAVTPY